jgi:gamma-glutamylcyclotransferase (GGCT)/AIG2-like uncharacterized protein YtfP
MQELTLLFQYGSNMASDRLLGRVREFAPQFATQRVLIELKPLGAAELRDWRFVADLYSAGGGCRVADIVESPGATVWGALYELPRELVRRSDGERSVLDRIEGHRTERHPENYQPLQVTVDVQGVKHLAWTYVGYSDARRRCDVEHSDATISDEYRGFVLAGAADVGLPSAYVAELVAVLNDQ